MVTMNEGATRKDIDEVIDIMKDFMSQVTGQFSNVDKQFDSVNKQFNEVNKRLDRFDRDYNHLINTIDSFIGRIDKYETELAARDSQFERLLVWARKVSEKTGIPLENV
jgi:archaellum component FlaC